MIKVTCSKKLSGGPGIFMRRLLEYMELHDMIRVVQSGGDIFFSNIWADNKPKKCKHVHRAASVYYDINQKKRHGMNKKIAKVVMSADHVVFQTKFAMQLHHKILKAKPKHSSIIYNGFDVGKYRSIDPIEINNKGPIFLACSNWSNKYKRLELIVKSFKSASIPDSKLIIIGQNANVALSDNITCIGHANTESIVSYIKRCNAFVHLCYAESCPNVVVEALSLGNPVICNNIGGSPEIVGDDGIIAQCDTPFVFKRRNVNISVVNFNSIVDSMKLVLQKNWNIIRSDLTMEHCASAYLSVFEQILSK